MPAVPCWACQRCTCVMVSRRMKLDRSPSARGQTRSWKWSGISAVRKQPHLVARDGLGQHPFECDIVVVGFEDGHAGVGPVEGMVHQSALRGSWWSGHTPRLSWPHHDVKNGAGPHSLATPCYANCRSR